MVLADPHTLELALRSLTKRKLSAPAVARSKPNTCCGETYVLITSNTMFLKHCTVKVSVSQSLFAVYLGMGTVGELVILGLWYTMYP